MHEGGAACPKARTNKGPRNLFGFGECVAWGNNTRGGGGVPAEAESRKVVLRNVNSNAESIDVYGLRTYAG